MRILHVIDTLGLGGAQTILKAVFDQQSEQDNIFIFALRQRDITIEINHPNITIYESTAKWSLAPIIALKNFVKEHNIDILHCHLFKSSVIGYLTKKLFCPQVKLIFHEHGQIVGSDTNSKTLDFVYDNFNRFASSSVDLFIAVSNAMKNLLVEKGKVRESKILTLYNFVDLDKFKNTFTQKEIDEYKKELNLNNNDFIVGFAGRIIPRKGWRTYIETAKILCSQYDDIRFLIAGDGADREEMLALIKQYNLSEKVHYLGYVKQMPKYYLSLNCFVMPSHFEGLPMSQLEVMALGVPLITTTGPGMDEIPQDNIDALFVKMKNPTDVAAKIIMLKEQTSLAQQLGQNAQSKVQKHSVKNYIEKLNKTYQVFRV